MPPKNNKKSKKVRDPRAYATTSTPAKARTRSRSLSKDEKSPTTAATSDPPPATLALPPSSRPAKDTSSIATYVSLDLAKRQASERIHHEQTLKQQLPTSPPTVYASARSEDHIVDLIRSGTLSIAPDFTNIARVEVREWAERANFVIETARAYGFDLFDIEQALDALSGAGGFMDVLAWLCTRVPAERLPVDMRDKLEFGQLQVTVEPLSEASGQRNVEPESFVREDSKETDIVMPDSGTICTTESDPPAAETNELSCLVAQIRSEAFGVEDAYDSDEEDPGLACGRHYVRVRAFEELLDYLRISNQNQQHIAEITAVSELIKSEKAAISKLEDDWIYRPERAEAEFNRLWPAYQGQLLDSIRRIKDSYVEEGHKESIGDVLDNSSECGLGAMFEEMLDLDIEPQSESQSSVAVLKVAPEHGWTGVPIRVLVDQHVHHFDKQAQVRFSTSKVSPRGHTSSISIVWSQPAKAARIAKHCRLLPGADFAADSLNHCWTLPSDIAGHTAHDARDLAALTLLYMQPEIGHQSHMRLPRELREQWLKWEQAEHHKQRKTVEQEHEARVELLQSLHAQYLLATEGHDSETTDTAADVPQARRSHTGRAQTANRAALARKRKWTSSTIKMRQRNDKWMLEFGAARERLPVTQHRSVIASTFQSNQVLIVRGETGSGKSSQIPQFVLQSLLETGYTGGRVMCTQPRRISTMAIAERVSSELGDPHIGGQSSLTGFQIRMNTKCADENALVFCTTGVLLRMLVDDPDLRSIDCVICDEVQERTIEFDYLLIVLRRVLRRRSDLRLVLMSATIDVSLFSMYFDNCPVIDIPGRTFPVRDMFLEDVVQASGYVLDPSSVYVAREDTRRAVTADGAYVDVSCYGDAAANAWRTVNKMRADKVDLDLICHLVRGICGSTDDSWTQYCRTNVPQGAILVFLPGIYEIRRLAAMLQSDSSTSQSMLVVPLHSAFANDRPPGNTLTYQELAFAPSLRVRKTVLATNVAETGITIPDVTVVIDCGMSNQMVYDSRLNISRLQTLPISRANVRQRRGRAGRVQPGLSLCLFTQHEFHKMREFELPEMQRLPLASLCLLAKAHGIRDVVQFMEQAVEPPRQSSVVHAVVELQTAGALDEDEQLTAIGRYLCYLPVDLAIGKLLVYGATLQCLDSVLTIAAACSLTTSLLNVPYDARVKELARQAHAKFASANANDSVSDHMISLNVYRAWKHLATQPHTTRSQLQKFCTENWLNRDAFDALEDLRERYLRLLYEQGLISYDQEQGPASRLIRPVSSSRAFRAGFARAPQSSISNDSWDIVCAAIVAAMDHTIMLSQNTGFVIGQTTVAKRVYGIGAAIQIRDRERIATRPICLDSSSLLQKHPDTHPSRHAIIATSLTGTSTTVTAHTLSRVHLPLCVLFARSLEYWPKAQLLIVDRWIKCKCRAKTALLLITMRDKVQEILEQRIRNPSVALSEELQKWMHAVVYYVCHLH